jgi:hypothetical protein
LKSSGIETTRTSTKIVASEPIAIVTRLSGTAAGSSTPSSRSATTSRTASPAKKTSLPRVPVCQPITETVTPSPEPVYQPVNADTVSTTPVSSVSRSPSPSRAALLRSNAPRTGNRPSGVAMERQYPGRGSARHAPTLSPWPSA